MLIMLVTMGLFTLTSAHKGRLLRERGLATLIRGGRIYLIVTVGLYFIAWIASMAPLVILGAAGLLAALVALRFLIWLYRDLV